MDSVETNMDDQTAAKKKYFATEYSPSPSSDDEADYPQEALPPSFAALTTCHDAATASEDAQGGREPRETVGGGARQNGGEGGTESKTSGPKSRGQAGAQSSAKLISSSSPTEEARTKEQNWIAVAQAVGRKGKHKAVAEAAETGHNDKRAAVDLSLMAASPPRRTTVINQPLAVQRTVSAPIAVPPPLNRLPSLARASSSNLSHPSKKRKKTAELKLQPLDKQIFRGLRFYFIPPDDIAPARRQRIIRARDFGAEPVRSWPSDPSNEGEGGITHVVVDKELTYADIKKFLGIPDTPWPESIILVNEDWTVDCIRYRLLVNHTQHMYQVRGFAKAREAAARAVEAGTAATGQVVEPSTYTGDEWNVPRALRRDGKGDKGLEAQVNGRMDARMQKKLTRSERWDYVAPLQTPERSVASESQDHIPGVARNPGVVGREGQVMDRKGDGGDLAKETEEEQIPPRVEKAGNLKGKTGEDLKRWFAVMNPDG